MTRALAMAVAAALLAAGVLFLRAETMSTHTPPRDGSRTRVSVQVATKNAEPSATEREMTRALVLTCRIEANSDLDDSGLRDAGPNTYRFTLTPALDQSDQLQLRGCLEDTRIDHLQLKVTALENLPPVRDGDA